MKLRDKLLGQILEFAFKHNIEEPPCKTKFADEMDKIEKEACWLCYRLNQCAPCVLHKNKGGEYVITR